MFYDRTTLYNFAYKDVANKYKLSVWEVKSLKLRIGKADILQDDTEKMLEKLYWSPAVCRKQLFVVSSLSQAKYSWFFYSHILYFCIYAEYFDIYSHGKNFICRSASR